MTTLQTITESEIQIAAGREFLSADLVIPPDATTLVLFAHGSGSSRHSPRNRYVAGELNEARIATLLADLLTEREEETDLINRKLRFDITLLTSRLVHLIDWLHSDERTAGLHLGLFGASTGAAAALDAAAARPASIRAVVSRGGRPDLARNLRDVQAPTLLIVGANDNAVLQMNHSALRELNCEKRLDVVPGATHLFEEPGCLERVASLARRWFIEHLG